MRVRLIFDAYMPVYFAMIGRSFGWVRQGENGEVAAIALSTDRGSKKQRTVLLPTGTVFADYVNEVKWNIVADKTSTDAL